MDTSSPNCCNTFVDSRSSFLDETEHAFSATRWIFVAKKCHFAEMSPQARISDEPRMHFFCA